MTAGEAHLGDRCVFDEPGWWWVVDEEPFPVPDEPDYLYVPIEWCDGKKDTYTYRRDQEIKGLVRGALVG